MQNDLDDAGKSKLAAGNELVQVLALTVQC
jgi:hypothetical protein